MSTKNRVKTEHAGAKNGGGYWDYRSVAKQKSKKLRQRNSKIISKLIDN